MVNISQIIPERETLTCSFIPLGVFRNSGEWSTARYSHSLFLYTNDTSNRMSDHKNPEPFYEKRILFLSVDPQLITYHSYPEPGTENAVINQSHPHQISNFIHMLVHSKRFPYQQTLQNIKTPIYYRINPLDPIYGLDYAFYTMTRFIIESSLDKQGSIVRYQKNDPSLVSKADDNLFRTIRPCNFHARWIRITVPENQQFFSLDQVQIFGRI